MLTTDCKLQNSLLYLYFTSFYDTTMIYVWFMICQSNKKIKHQNQISSNLPIIELAMVIQKNLLKPIICDW